LDFLFPRRVVGGAVTCVRIKTRTLHSSNADPENLMIRFRSPVSSFGKDVALLLVAALLANLPACRSSARAREHLEKGNQHFAQKQLFSAEDEYRQAIQINPDFAEAYYRLGILQIQLEHPTAASQSLIRAVDLDPKSLDARLQLGELQLSSTQYVEAREQAEAVLQQNSKSAGAHRLLAKLRFIRGNTLLRKMN